MVHVLSRNKEVKGCFDGEIVAAREAVVEYKVEGGVLKSLILFPEVNEKGVSSVDTFFKEKIREG